jgi:hypothetical protein
VNDSTIVPVKNSNSVMHAFTLQVPETRDAGTEEQNS